MESWRAFRLEEEEGRKFKENPKDAVELLGIIPKLDQEQQNAVGEKIASDPDIAPVISALEELFKELEREPVEEAVGPLNDLGSEISGALGDGANKVSEFLEGSAAGRVLKKVSGPVLGLALAWLLLQGVGEGGGNLNKSSEFISRVMTSGDPQSMLAGSAEVMADVMTESLRERKKT